MWLTGRSKDVDEDRQQGNISVTLLQWLLHRLRLVLKRMYSKLRNGHWNQVHMLREGGCFYPSIQMMQGCRKLSLIPLTIIWAMIWIPLHSGARLAPSTCGDQTGETLGGWACNLPVQYIFLLSRASKRWLIAYWSVWHWTSRSVTVALNWLATVVILDFRVSGSHKMGCQSPSWEMFLILQKHLNLPEAEKVSATLPPSSFPSLTSCCCSGCDNLVAKSTISSLLILPLTWEIPSNAENEQTQNYKMAAVCACVPQRDWPRDSEMSPFHLRHSGKSPASRGWQHNLQAAFRRDYCEEE